MILELWHRTYRNPDTLRTNLTRSKRRLDRSVFHCGSSVSSVDSPFPILFLGHVANLQLAKRIHPQADSFELQAQIFNAIARVLFYTGVLNLFNRFVNKFEYNKNEEGKLGFPFVKRRKAGNVQILVYHRVNDDSDAFFPGTPIDVFKNQMEYLAANFNICSLDEAVERMVSKDVPDNTVVITFDDGYRDNYLNAFPMLKNLSIPATIFLATDAIGSKRVLWHDRVFSAFRETRVPVLRGLVMIHEPIALNTLKRNYLLKMRR